tara:strand:- start:217 stop:594 length:378 start_codon:yes stop_codon:yes gene_type:complete
MITITLNNVNTLNNSLQVGDMVYTIKTTQQTGSQDLQDTAGVGVTKIVGILRRITQNSNIVSLEVDESSFLPPNIPNNGDFLMFSKYDQTDGDVNGYYAEAKFKNNSKEKAELFSVGSEIIMNSK